jgi:hypothetical protein
MTCYLSASLQEGIFLIFAQVDKFTGKTGEELSKFSGCCKNKLSQRKFSFLQVWLVFGKAGLLVRKLKYLNGWCGNL